MKTIYKYQLKDRVSEIEIPIDFNILAIQNQDNCIFLWAVVDTDYPKEKRTFYLLGTGQELPDNFDDLEYLDTVQQNEYVWHVYF